MNSKADVRRTIRAQLLQMSAVAQKSARICEAIAGEGAWQQARTVALFAPQVIEPDVELLWSSAAGKTFCYPRVRASELDLLRVEDRAALVFSRWKVREPPENIARCVPLAEIDLILVPGLAFTRGGRRLGRGGGYYDRLLATPELRALKIGVCFHLQLLDDLPHEPHDERVDRVVTEAGVQQP